MRTCDVNSVSQTYSSGRSKLLYPFVPQSRHGGAGVLRRGANIHLVLQFGLAVLSGVEGPPVAIPLIEGDEWHARAHAIPRGTIGLRCCLGCFGRVFGHVADPRNVAEQSNRR
jgi:hypothetical protein